MSNKVRVPVSDYLNEDIVKKQIISLSDNAEYVMIPVLINYVPVMIKSNKNYYLCLVYDDKKLTLAFSSTIKSNSIVQGDIPYSQLTYYLENNTISSLLDEEKITNKLIKNNTIQVIDTEYILSLGRNYVGSFNIMTDEYESLIDVIKYDSVDLKDEMLKLCIEMQARIDDFSYKTINQMNKINDVRYLNHMMLVDLDITKDGSPLSILARNSNFRTERVQVDGMDMSMDLEGKLEIRRTVLDNNTNYLSSQATRIMKYKVVGLGILIDDFGENKISGITRYPVTKNNYIISLMCLDRLYRNLYNNKINTIYRNKYESKQYVSNKAVIYSLSGKYSFYDYITERIFK